MLPFSYTLVAKICSVFLLDSKTANLDKDLVDSRLKANWNSDKLNFFLNRFLRHCDDPFGHYDDQGKVSVDCRLRTYRDQLMLQENHIFLKLKHFPKTLELDEADLEFQSNASSIPNIKLSKTLSL